LGRRTGPRRAFGGYPVAAGRPHPRPLVGRLLAGRRDREALYDSIDPFGPELPAQDARNFRIPRSDVAQTRFRRNRSLWTPSNVGSIEIRTSDGAVRRLILVGDQNADAILDLIRRFDPATEVTGRPTVRHKPLTSAGRRVWYGLLAVLLFGAGGLFGYAAWAGMGAPNLLRWPLAVGSLVAGGWCFARVLRDSDVRSESDTAAESDRAARAERTAG
jgi:hypothetical protein